MQAAPRLCLMRRSPCHAVVLRPSAQAGLCLARGLVRFATRGAQRDAAREENMRPVMLATCGARPRPMRCSSEKFSLSNMDRYIKSY